MKYNNIMDLTSLQQILIYLTLIIILVLCLKMIFNLSAGNIILVCTALIIAIFGMSFKQVFKLSVENYENEISSDDSIVSSPQNPDDVNIVLSQESKVNSSQDLTINRELNNATIVSSAQPLDNTNVISLSNITSSIPKSIAENKQLIKSQNDDMKDIISKQYSLTNSPDKYVDLKTYTKNNQTTSITNVDVNETKLREDIKNDTNYTSQSDEYEQAINKEKNIAYKSNDSIVTDENIYAFDDFGYINAHQLYIPTDYKTDPTDYGRNYIPVELWYKNNLRLNLPVCVPANERCTIKDTLTSGYPLDNVEWHASRRVTNPDGINVRYIEEKLNTGH